MPGTYADEMSTRRESGDDVPATVGVRALLALESAETEDVVTFTQLLEDLRSHPVTDDGRLSPAFVWNGEYSAADVDAHISELRDASSPLVEMLTIAAADVAAGRAATLPDAAVSEWNTHRTNVWTSLGFDSGRSSGSFQELEAVREFVVEEEARLAEEARLVEEARLAAQAVAEREQNRRQILTELDQHRQAMLALRSLADSADSYRAAYDDAARQVAALEAQLEALAGSGDGVRTNDSDAADNRSSGGGSSEDSVQPCDIPEVPPADIPETVDADASAVAGVDQPAGTGPTDDAVEVGSLETDGDTAAVAVDDSTTHPDGDRSEPAAAADVPDETAPADTEAADFTAQSSSAATEQREPDVEPEPAVESDTSAVACVDPAILDEELAFHITNGRFGAAWLVAWAAALPQADQTAYRLAAAAFHSAPGAVDPAEPLIAVTALPDDPFIGQQSARVALAATLRAGLTAGWLPRSEVDSITRHASLDDAWRELVAAALLASTRNYQHLQDFGGTFGTDPNEVRANARTLRHQMTQSRIKFTRADMVRRHLLRDNEPLGAALCAVEADTDGDERREALTSALTALANPDSLIDGADHAVSSSQQLRAEIVAHARTTLRKSIESVSECVTEALSAATIVADDSRAALTQEARHQLAAAAHAVAERPLGDGPGDQALVQLVEWLLHPTPPTRWPGGERQVLVTASLPVTSLARDDQGLPVYVDGCHVDVLADLRDPKPVDELFRTYVDRGDLDEAAMTAVNSPLLDRIPEQRARWTRRLTAEVGAVRAEIGRTFADDFTTGDRVSADADLVGPETFTGNRFDLQMIHLEQMRTRLKAHRAATAERLRGQVLSEIDNVADRDTVLSVIDAEDFAAANEMLSLAKTGPLPNDRSIDTNVGAQVFESFMAALGYLDTSTIKSIRDVVAQFAEHGSGEIGHGDLGRLNNWDNLSARRGQGRQGRQATMASVLRAIGLEMRGEVSKQPVSGRHFDLYRVTATPVDGSLVPGLGSLTSHYMIAVTSESQLIRQTLSSAFPAKHGPNILLFDGVLTAEQRRMCLTACRSEKITAIVIDHAVAAYVATHHPRSFRAVQQITLPWTCFTHYTVVAGHVPDEVFVGRAQEEAHLTARDGSLFVYGGRQLGKSALLRHAARDFGSVDDQHAIYIDLNAHGIGGWEETQQLWQVLYNELVKIGSMGIKPNPNVRSSEPVVRTIRNWLDGKESRRLLLLLDEADAFLESESVSGTAGFRHIGPLKGLFDSSAGRFKPVFAGLHKVQRLQNVANTPLAHGGDDILIGPLAAQPAHDLVIKPMEALGYRFANPDAVWRLLAFTNLQPGLIQMVCNDLITHLQGRPLHKGEPLITVSDDDVNAVTQNPVTRDKIAEKLRLTIQLEDRYRVIALAVAIMCMDDAFQERYSADDIRWRCEYYWEDGFSDLNSTEFGLYLDELCGLGVLIKDHGRFSVRSPNIVTMLGNRDQLETVLDEAEFELGHEYSPKSTRRQVQLDGALVRSPLSEDDLSTLLPMHNRHDARTFVVVGGTALGIDKVTAILEYVGADRRIDVSVVDGRKGSVADEINAVTFAGGGNRKATLLIVDASATTSDQAQAVAEAVTSMPSRARGHVIVVYGPDGVDAIKKHAGDDSTTVIRLRKWSGDGIRSWHDMPFIDPADRRELLSTTGGWPALVEQAVAAVTNGGVSHDEEFKNLAEFPATHEAAVQFLNSVGVGDHARDLLAQWADFGSTDFEPLIDIADVLERDVDDMRTILTDMEQLGVVDEHHDSYLLDPVVGRAVRVLAS
ncbi:hypothetical protein ACWDTI_02770 [Gordonia sp. NPDC003424]